MGVSQEEKVKSQAGSGESWEAAHFLPNTTEVHTQHWRATLRTLAPVAYPQGSSGGEHRTEQCKGLHKITRKLPQPQTSLGRKRKPWMDAMKAAAPPAAPFSVRTSLHYPTLHPYHHPTSPPRQPCSEGWLAATTHRKAVSQLVCTGNKMWRTEEGKGHI